MLWLGLMLKEPADAVVMATCLLHSYLMEFLCKLAEHCDVNKMTPSNLGIVIGPNLLWPPDKRFVVYYC